MTSVNVTATAAHRVNGANGKSNGHAGPLQHALALSSIAYRVMPHSIADTADSTRHPYLNDWGNAASRDPQVITSWAGLFQRAGGVGILVGDDDTLGIDIDEPHAPALNSVCQAIPRQAAVVLSGGGGWHCYFKHTAHSRQQLRPLGNASLKGEKREKCIELFTNPHAMLAPGTRHQKTGKIYQWRDPNCAEPTPIPDKLVDVLLALPWQAKASGSNLISFNEVVLKPDVDVTALMASIGMQLKGDKFAATVKQPCPNDGRDTKSNTTWVLFYKPDRHSLRFFCHSCRGGHTRDVLAKLGIDVEDVAAPSMAAAISQQGLVLTSMPLDEQVPLCKKMLLDKGTGRDGLFRRGEYLVRVAQWRDMPEFQITDKCDPNTNIIRPLTDVSIRYELSKCQPHRIFRTTKTGGLQAADVDLKVVETIIDEVVTRPETAGWPYLSGVMRTPMLLEDGSIVQEPGYNQLTAVWLDIDPKQFPKVPEKPTRADALKALHKFDPVFERFPFVDANDEPVSTAAVNKDWHKAPGGAVILSAVLSIVARNLLPETPCIAVDAPTQRTGKTKLAEAAVGAATGLILNPTDYKGEAEFEKGLLPLLRRGPQAVLVDNVTRYFGSSGLSIVLTTPGEPELRVLGSSEMERIRNTAVWFITGNNLVFILDMSRGRVIKCSIDARMEHPEMRNFNTAPDPPVYARQHFPQLAVAALTMLRAYIQAGKPWDATVAHAGTFIGWSKLVRGCLLWLGCADPWLTTIDVSEDDPNYDQDLTLLEKWFHYTGDVEHTLKQLRGMTLEAESTPLKPVTLFEYLFGNDRGIDEGKIGARLNRVKRKVTGDYRLKAIRSTGRSNKWKVMYLGKDKKLLAKTTAYKEQQAKKKAQRSKEQ